MDEERVVLLGTIQERQSVDNSSPYVCKAGGTAAWYSDPPLAAKDLVCGKCGTDLFLVAQVYAPVDSDRTLYVFGCNSVACTESPGSWRVLRDQAVQAKESTEPVEAVEKLVEKVDNVKLAWGSDSDDSDWGDDEDDSGKQSQGADEVDLEALLQQRDDAMKIGTTMTKPVANAKKTEFAKDSTVTTKKGQVNAFPALSIEVIDEPYEDYTAEHNFAHENKLLEEYMKHEEEEKSADIGDLRNVISNSKKKGAAAQSGSSGAPTGESYEKTPAAQRHLLRFQKRISRCPLQCLRYDYGGEPLWPVVIPPSLKVPACSGCGGERLFEMQLTPTINYFLKVDEYAAADAKSSSNPSIATADTENDATKPVMPPGGMDWLSLIVYCCSNSCSASHEEFIYVVPSPTN
ncbi:programmed cell death protein [Phytophthora boehmeriae]|uniref:Programmed cell death protein n=1 Tax=Phytophthora boehmeriae TaxID=109152 RepID=A0A8T1X2K4_9STRA|nr:programmed cell death protein [Phytophthora boehmeriae]